MQMVPKNETGARMRITGTLYQPNGRTPYPGVILYAYQADHNGYYRQSETDKGIIKQHGCLHGWCVTDSNGRYEIITIRPGKLPGKALPAQIHTAVQEPGRDSSFYIRDFVFSDDKLVSETYLKQQKLPGGDGVVKLKRDSSGTWTGKRDITLPKNKP